MSEHQSENTRTALSNDDLLLHASAMLDGEAFGDGPDGCESASEEARSLVDQFQQNARFVSSLLRKIPVHTVSKPIIQSGDLQRQIQGSSVVKVPVTHQAIDRPSRQKFAGIVSILTMTGCLLIGLFTPHTDDSALPRITANWKVRKAAANAVVDFPSEDQWNVVVVRMDHRDRTTAIQAVQRVIREHGFDFARSAGKDMPEWLGVVLSADADESRALLEDLRNTVPMGSVEQDPSRIAESSREELIAAVQESLRHPTLSELHHGRVYLAMPEGDRQDASDDLRMAATDIEASESRLRSADQQGDVVLRAPAAIESAATGSAAAGVNIPLRRDGVMLVVFQFDQFPAADLKI